MASTWSHKRNEGMASPGGAHIACRAAAYPGWPVKGKLSELDPAYEVL